MKASHAAGDVRPLPHPREFVAMMAALMALHAMSIDTMLPALPVMAREFGIRDLNQTQWVVTLLIVGSGVGQLVYGPLSDRFGRRRVLLVGLVLFVVISTVAALARDFGQLLTLRWMQGASVAATGVVARAVVRDTSEGDRMARRMSSILMVFMVVPIVAPSLGQVLLLWIGWRGIFGFLAATGAAVAVWVSLRLPETLPPAKRQPASAAHLGAVLRFVLTEPTSILYSLALTAMFGSLLTFVSLMPQVFEDYFRRPEQLGLAFAGCASAIAVASFTNSRVVERVGMYRISHAALAGFLAMSFMHAIVAWQTHESLGTFVVLQAATLGCYALTASNFGAIAMQPMGRIAGSAASIQGAISTIGAALLAKLVGEHWTGSLAILPSGAFACGCVALACVLAAQHRQFARRAKPWSG